MSYSGVSDHRSMIFDDIRNSAYAKAIAERVTPESVVLDLGAGLGILGLLAAQAGARRVYLVEPESVVQLALEFARDNGLSDRIVVLQGRIEEIDLPEKVDLILSVFTGNLLFSEDLLPSLFHARDRYLKPGGQLLPDRAELLLAPLHCPALHETQVARWSAPELQLNLAAARRFAANDIVWLARKDFSGTILGTAAVVHSLDLSAASQADCNGLDQSHIHTAGVCHGLLGWIRIKVGDEWLSTDPASPALHWSNAVLPIDPPLPVVVGEAVTIGVQRPCGGDWSWKLAATAGLRRHSTFLARLDGPQRLSRLAAGGRPGLSVRGAAALQVLSLLQANSSLQEIASALSLVWPLLFADGMAALQFVQSVADDFAAPATSAPQRTGKV